MLTSDISVRVAIPLAFLVFLLSFEMTKGVRKQGSSSGREISGAKEEEKYPTIFCQANSV